MVVSSHHLVYQHVAEHRLEWARLLCVKHLTQQHDGIEKLGIIKNSMRYSMVIILTACLLEGGIEDFDAKLVGDHVALDSEEQELSEVHVAALKTWLNKNMKTYLITL